MTWKAGLCAVVLSAGFLLYLHSGWFRVDMSNPLFPLRRDEHGQLIQRKAFIAALLTGMLVYFLGGFFLGEADIPTGVLSGLGASAGVIAYFVTQAVLFLKGR